MTTIVELPGRLQSTMRNVQDYREHFRQDVKQSDVITFTKEYFADCFTSDVDLLKGILIRVYQFGSAHGARVTNYRISWEDVPKSDVETWAEFRSRVDQYLREFIHKLQREARVLEGSL